MNMDFKRKLPIPMETKEMYPLTGDMAETVERRTAELKAIFAGTDPRMVMIIGPCSADSVDSVMDYISRLIPVQERVKDKVLIVPRIYTNKPRTTGDGYKGYVHQPDPTAEPDLFKGVIATREMHMRAVKETGFACADEMLYPENYKYLDDLLGYVAVGARSVEDQQHRLTASAIDCPVGMKNPTSGDLSVMMNAILAAQHQHDFIYRGWRATPSATPMPTPSSGATSTARASPTPTTTTRPCCTWRSSTASGTWSTPASSSTATTPTAARTPSSSPASSRRCCTPAAATRRCGNW